jgi:hypothetical protein
MLFGRISFLQLALVLILFKEVFSNSDEYEVLGSDQNLAEIFTPNLSSNDQKDLNLVKRAVNQVPGCPPVLSIFYSILFYSSYII